MAWKDLNFKERAAYIHTGVRNGLTSMEDIENAYNEYANGGQISIEENPLPKPFSYGGIPSVRYSNGGHLYDEGGDTMWEHQPDNIDLVTGNATSQVNAKNLMANIYYDEDGNVRNKNTGEIVYLSTPEVVVTPTRESYIQQKADEYAKEALAKMLSTKSPVATTIGMKYKYSIPEDAISKGDYRKNTGKGDYTKQVLSHNDSISKVLNTAHSDGNYYGRAGETCISSATFPFGNESFSIFNPEFAENYAQKGFAKVLDHSTTPDNIINDRIVDNGALITRGNYEVSKYARPGDLYQMWQKPHNSNSFVPFHTGMISEVGDNTLRINQSHGEYDSTDNKYYGMHTTDGGMPYDTDNNPLFNNYIIYRFIGTPSQQQKWGNAYDSFPWHTQACGGHIHAIGGENEIGIPVPFTLPNEAPMTQEGYIEEQLKNPDNAIELSNRDSYTKAQGIKNDAVMQSLIEEFGRRTNDSSNVEDLYQRTPVIQYSKPGYEGDYMNVRGGRYNLPGVIRISDVDATPSWDTSNRNTFGEARNRFAIPTLGHEFQHDYFFNSGNKRSDKDTDIITTAYPLQFMDDAIIRKANNDRDLDYANKLQDEMFSANTQGWMDIVNRNFASSIGKDGSKIQGVGYKDKQGKWHIDKDRLGSIIDNMSVDDVIEELYYSNKYQKNKGKEFTNYLYGNDPTFDADIMYNKDDNDIIKERKKAERQRRSNERINAIKTGWKTVGQNNDSNSDSPSSDVLPIT